MPRERELRGGDAGAGVHGRPPPLVYPSGTAGVGGPGPFELAVVVAAPLGIALGALLLPLWLGAAAGPPPWTVLGVGALLLLAGLAVAGLLWACLRIGGGHHD